MQNPQLRSMVLFSSLDRDSPPCLVYSRIFAPLRLKKRTGRAILNRWGLLSPLVENGGWNSGKKIQGSVAEQYLGHDRAAGPKRNVTSDLAGALRHQDGHDFR